MGFLIKDEDFTQQGAGHLEIEFGEGGFRASIIPEQVSAHEASDFEQGSKVVGKAVVAVVGAAFTFVEFFREVKFSSRVFPFWPSHRSWRGGRRLGKRR